GLDVLEADTGTVRWRDGKASDAWAYDDLVLSVTCTDDGDGCTLRARSSSDGTTRWRRGIDSAAQRLAGYPELEDAVDRVGMLPPDYPGATPRLVGVVTDRRVIVVDTRTGAVRGELPETESTRVTMVGDRVLGVVAKPNPNGGCRHSVRAWNPSGAEVWRRAGYDFGTVSGSGCEQRVDPVGAGGVVAAVRPDNQPVLLGVRGGEVRWTGKAGETVVATDGRVALVRNADGRLTAVNAETGDQLWHRTAGEEAKVVVTSGAVLIADWDGGTVTAVSPGSGGVLGRWETRADLIGADDAGMVLASGRTVGYATW
ncbi:MAG: PQQ-binding-like beta-propeller repeat protein, partial [Micromonosporaceae bacterium]